MDDVTVRWLAIGALLAMSAACAALLRWARLPGGPSACAIVGGLMAGILLGPGILGRLMPETYERGFEGGVEQRQARDSLARRHGAELFASQGAGLERDQLHEMQTRHAQEIAAARLVRRDAQWLDQQPRRVITLLIVALTLLGAGLMIVRERDTRQGLIAPLSIGAWSALLPGALAFAAAAWLWGHPPAAVAAIACAVAIGPWMLPEYDRRAADQAEYGGARMIQTAGRIASTIAIAIVFWAMWLTREVDGLWCASVMLALPLGWIVGPIVLRATTLVTPQAVLSTAYSVLLPALAACAVVTIDPYQDFSIWPLVVILLLSDDGRWCGAFLGAMLPGGRRSLRTMRLVLGSMAAGPTQLAMTAVAAQARILPEDCILPLVLGAALIEISAPARRLLAERIIESEQEMEHDSR